MTAKAWMSEEEKNLIKSYLNKDTIMLEWGSGGSTIEFSKLVKKYYSIEHDIRWFREIRNSIKKYKIDNIDYNLVKPNCGGYRIGYTPKKDFNDYVEYIHKLNINRYDIILIDGRARPHCAIECLDYVDNESIVFIHDYYNRLNYHIVEKYYDIIDGIKEGQSIVALRKKK